MRPSDATRASAARTKFQSSLNTLMIRAAGWLAVTALAFSVVAAASSVVPCAAHASDDTPWVLTDGERREFLRAYAPIILKRADEDADRGESGRDWMTNFEFDGDRDFSNNKRNWMSRLPAHMDGRDTLDIRPTVYTSVVEIWDEGQKSLILTYYPYHAMDEERIHDWERVEMRIDGVVGAPRSGEKVAYVVVTQHKEHRGRKRGHDDLHFLKTATGKHVLLLRAEWSNDGELRKNELRFVRDGWRKLRKRIVRDSSARVRINGARRRQNFHYAFVEQSDLEAVLAWGAEPLAPCNARRLAAGVERDRIRMSKVKGLSYEMQDIADLVVTQWEGAGHAESWTGSRRVRIAEAMQSDDGEIAIPSGDWTFFPKVNGPDGSDGGGLVGSSWFFGGYHFDGERFQHSDDALEAGQISRFQARPANVVRGWYQHEYFVHTGEKGKGRRHGRWLEAGWQQADHGGFDGRWHPLFAPDANARRATSCRGDAVAQ